MMIPEKRFREILTKLLEKSRANLVHWRASGSRLLEQSRTNLAHSEGIGPKYFVQFSDNVEISIGYYSDPARPDYAEAEFWYGGRPVQSISAEDGGDTETFELLRELWTHADRTVIGWDHALDVVESVLDAQGKVGLPQ